MSTTISPLAVEPQERPVTKAPPEVRYRGWLFAYLLLGVVFGVILIKSEVVSWFRIQEMFRFQGFHMYGIFASALAVAIPTVTVIRGSSLRALSGDPIRLRSRRPGRLYRYAIGGAVFGVGWAFTGACPGPLFGLLGAGIGVMAVAILSALAGAWVYGYLQPKLPH